MEVRFCDGCTRRIEEEDFTSGHAAEVDGNFYCPKCLKAKMAKGAARPAPAAPAGPARRLTPGGGAPARPNTPGQGQPLRRAATPARGIPALLRTTPGKGLPRPAPTSPARPTPGKGAAVPPRQTPGKVAAAGGPAPAAAGRPPVPRAGPPALPVPPSLPGPRPQPAPPSQPAGLPRKPPTTKMVLRKPTTAAQRPPTGPAPAQRPPTGPALAQRKPPTGKVAAMGGASPAAAKPASGKAKSPSSKVETVPVESVGSGWGRTILIGLGLLVVGAVIGYFGLMLLTGSEAPAGSRSAAPPSPPALPLPAGKSAGATAAEPAPSGAQNPGGGLTVTLKDYRGKLKRPTVEAAGTANSFRVGSLAASDRGEAWTKVPAEFSGLPRLLTAREDRCTAPTEGKYVVSVSGPCTIYVPLDPAYGAKSLPWMNGSWQDSGLTCETTKGTDVKVCRIWKRSVAAAGEVTLGCDTKGSTCGMCYVFDGAAEARR